MDIISSRQTVFVKRIFPAVWLLLVAGIPAIFNLSLIAAHKFDPTLLLGPIVMIAVFAIVYRRLIGVLADEVRDGGSFLVVRRGSVEERVQLTNVMNVSASQFSRSPRVSLRLRTPGKFGDEIVFLPKRPALQFVPFARNAVAEDLMRRVDRARQGER